MVQHQMKFKLPSHVGKGSAQKLEKEGTPTFTARAVVIDKYIVQRREQAGGSMTPGVVGIELDLCWRIQRLIRRISGDT